MFAALEIPCLFLDLLVSFAAVCERDPGVGLAKRTTQPNRKISRHSVLPVLSGYLEGGGRLRIAKACFVEKYLVAGMVQRKRRDLSVRSQGCHFRKTAARGGRVRTREWGRPCAAWSEAC